MQKNIKRVRVLRGLTQLQVQMATGISQSTLSKYESGETLPMVDNLKILAKFYRTSADYLLDIVDDPKPYPPPSGAHTFKP